MKYEFMEHDIYDLSDNPDLKTVSKTMDQLSLKIRNGKKARPVENYLVVLLFAGHGILKDGVQHVLLNQYDAKTQFYKLLAVEKKLRGWSEFYHNSYLISIFACCRQNYDPITMTGCIEKKKALDIILD